MPEQQSPDPHRTTTVENGPFCSARCSCGWRGPARRARSKARADADAHSAPS
ncbi:hypothetical protein ABZ626_25215 [Streptomyces longispororuber]|uniref:hypothetical protein n=1 Tax=Streptomyces TaxID=1883 RepID=UPI0024A87A9A|nr:hypothetical protein [Streptomyces sp. CC224B]